MLVPEEEENYKNFSPVGFSQSMEPQGYRGHPVACSGSSTASRTATPPTRHVKGVSRTHRSPEATVAAFLIRFNLNQSELFVFLPNLNTSPSGNFPPQSLPRR